MHILIADEHVVLVIVDGQVLDGELARLRDLVVVERRTRVTDGRADAREQLARAERLFDVVVRAEVERHDLVMLVRARRNDDDRQARPRTNLLEDVYPVHVGKPQVENDEIGAVRGDHRDRLGTRLRHQHVEVVRGENRRNKVADVLLVFHHEHFILQFHC